MAGISGLGPAGSVTSVDVTSLGPNVSTTGSAGAPQQDLNVNIDMFNPVLTTNSGNTGFADLLVYLDGESLTSNGQSLPVATKNGAVLAVSFSANGSITGGISLNATNTGVGTAYPGSGVVNTLATMLVTTGPGVTGGTIVLEAQIGGAAYGTVATVTTSAANTTTVISAAVACTAVRAHITSNIVGGNVTAYVSAGV